MLPTNSLQTTRLNVEDTLHPVRSTTQVLDVLSEFIPGQKLIAQIQFQLANGAYRASIAQRDVTLALPFSAKPGDALELEVVETEGRIAFAVSKQPAEDNKGTAQAQAASASTTLSRTGQMIAKLLQNADPEQQKPAPLNAGEPVLKAPPSSSKEVAPALQQAVARSGLFYESHQAAWVAGKLTETALRQEPQAQSARPGLQIFSAHATLPTSAPPSHPAGGTLGNIDQLSRPSPAAQQTQESGIEQAQGKAPTPLNLPPRSADPLAEAEQGRALAEATNSEVVSTAKSRSPLNAELTPLVQQQLSSLANNVYPFQGAIWPGQQILWEIVDEDGGRENDASEDTPRQWKTRLKLLLPSLGDIDATIQLDGNDLSVQMRSSETATRRVLKADIESLRSRLDLAGLRLTALEVKSYDDDQPIRRSEA